MDKYEMVEKIGQGAYGAVYRARNLDTGDMVAIKRSRRDREVYGVAASTIRETSLVMSLNHRNIIKMHEMTYDDDHIYIVFENLDLDLKQHMETSTDFQDPRTVKCFLKQILEGVAYCHTRKVLHRDLKPQNLLVDRRNNLLKIADFGLSKAFPIPVQALSHEVVTLFYRAPEIILGLLYSAPVDIWSVGCIFAEMVTKKVLFYGDSEIGQLHTIFRVMGTPTEDTWKGITKLPNYLPTFPKWAPTDLATLVPNLEPAGMDLLSKMLRLDPDTRITARDALKHDYFKDLTPSRQMDMDERTIPSRSPSLLATPETAELLATPEAL